MLSIKPKILNFFLLERQKAVALVKINTEKPKLLNN